MARTIRKLPFLLLSIFSLSRPRPIYIQLIKIPLFRCLLNFSGSSFIRNWRRWTPQSTHNFQKTPSTLRNQLYGPQENGTLFHFSICQPSRYHFGELCATKSYRKKDWAETEAIRVEPIRCHCTKMRACLPGSPLFSTQLSREHSCGKFWLKSGTGSFMTMSSMS